MFIRQLIKDQMENTNDTNIRNTIIQLKNSEHFEQFYHSMNTKYPNHPNFIHLRIQCIIEMMGSYANKEQYTRMNSEETWGKIHEETLLLIFQCPHLLQETNDELSILDQFNVIWERVCVNAVPIQGEMPKLTSQSLKQFEYKKSKEKTSPSTISNFSRLSVPVSTVQKRVLNLHVK